MESIHDRDCTILSLPRRMSLFSILERLYKNEIYPTQKSLYKEFLKDFEERGEKILPFEKFSVELGSLGIVYGTISRSRCLVMENTEQIFERVLYLKKMKRVRECKEMELYYLDVRLVNETCKFHKPKEFEKEDTNMPPNQYIFYHLISSEKYVHGLFSNKFTLETFNRWMIDNVLKTIKPSSVIVLNNTILTNMDESAITRLSLKSSMIKYLKTKNIPFNENMAKVELYELITRHPQSTSESSIEKIFKAEGYELIQLPKSIDILTATEIMWETIRANLGEQNINEFLIVKNFITNTIKAVNVETWGKWNEEVMDMEKKIYEQDLNIELAFENLLSA